MMARPWMKFYPADWQSDERLGMCSLAARALWMEMLALMHKADPYGHLLVNGLKPNDAQLAALARASCDQIRTCLQELDLHGVFSRTRNGTIYSRRMTRDEKRRKDGVKSAENGTLDNSRRHNQASEMIGENLPPPGVVEGVAGQPPPHLEARVQSLEREVPNGTVVAFATPDSSPVKEAFDAYNATAEKHGLPTARALSADRKRKLAARLREHGLDGWLNALGEIANAPFLLGKGERGWRAGLDFLLKPDKLNKLIEGSYRDQPRAGPGSGVRLNGTGWIIPHGTPEYAAWRKHYAVESSPSVYDFPLDKPGHEARAPARWPSQMRR